MQYHFCFVSFGGRIHDGIPGEGVDSSQFDGNGGVVGHAYLPSSGRIHFDQDEIWSFAGSTSSGWWLWSTTASVSMIDVATHEIGHALGLGHSVYEDAVMWPTTSIGNPSLHSDDVSGINALYSCK